MVPKRRRAITARSFSLLFAQIRIILAKKIRFLGGKVRFWKFPTDLETILERTNPTILEVIDKMFRSVLTWSNNDNKLPPLRTTYSETFIDFRWWETQTAQLRVLVVSIPRSGFGTSNYKHSFQTWDLPKSLHLSFPHDRKHNWKHLAIFVGGKHKRPTRVVGSLGSVLRMWRIWYRQSQTPVVANKGYAAKFVDHSLVNGPSLIQNLAWIGQQKLCQTAVFCFFARFKTVFWSDTWLEKKGTC